MDNKIKKVVDRLSAVGVEVICPQSSLSEQIAAYHTSTKAQYIDKIIYNLEAIGL